MARHERVSIRVDCDGCGASELEKDALNRGWRRVTVTSSTIAGANLNRAELDLCSECVGKIVVPGIPR